MAKKKERRTARENARRRAEKRQKESEFGYLALPEGMSMLKVKKEGVKRLDFLPYMVTVDHNPYADKDTLHYERTFYTHRSIGTEPNTYICPQKTIGKKCPICEAKAKLSAAGFDDCDTEKEVEVRKKQISDLRPKERQIFNVIDMTDPDKGIQIWDVSFYLFGKKLDAQVRNIDEDEDYDGFMELKGGSTLKIGFEEKSFDKNKFYDVESIHFKPRKKDYGEDILEEVAHLDEILRILPYNELRKIFLQLEDDDDDEDGKKGTKERKKDAKKVEKDDKEDEFVYSSGYDDESSDDKTGDDDEDKTDDEDKDDKKGDDDGDNKCPFDHTFGKDNDKTDDCKTCEKKHFDIWDACDDASG